MIGGGLEKRKEQSDPGQIKINFDTAERENQERIERFQIAEELEVDPSKLIKTQKGWGIIEDGTNKIELLDSWEKRKEREKKKVENEILKKQREEIKKREEDQNLPWYQK